MAKVMRISDKIKIKIKDLEFLISPLSVEHKKNLANATTIIKGKETYDLYGAQCIYLKHGLKDVKGIEYFDGEKFELQFDDDEKTTLTDDCVTELMGLECKSDLMQTAMQLLNGFTDQIYDGHTGEKMKSVEVEVVSSKK